MLIFAGRREKLAIGGLLTGADYVQALRHRLAPDPAATARTPRRG